MMSTSERERESTSDWVHLYLPTIHDSMIQVHSVKPNSLPTVPGVLKPNWNPSQWVVGATPGRWKQTSSRLPLQHPMGWKRLSQVPSTKMKRNLCLESFLVFLISKANLLPFKSSNPEANLSQWHVSGQCCLIQTSLGHWQCDVKTLAGEIQTTLVFTHRVGAIALCWSFVWWVWTHP